MNFRASIYLTLFLLAGICCASAMGAKSIELRAGTVISNERWWNVHGPDLNGGYGGLEGMGGLEAVVNEATGEAVGMIDDAQGSMLGFYKALNTQQAASFDYATAPKTFEWSVSRFTGYGALPGYWTPGVEDTPAPWQSFGWRGKRMDVTGFYSLGARYYEPNSGRFISPDPLGHDASMGLYDYAGGDPINFVDPRGRSAVNIFASAVTSSAAWSMSSSTNSMLSALGRNGYDNYAQNYGNNQQGWGGNNRGVGIIEPSCKTVDSFSRPNTFMSMFSAAVNMIPVVGTLKSFIELSSGNDMFTGEQISKTQATFNVLSSAIPFAMGSVSKFGAQAIGTSMGGLSSGAMNFSRPAMNIGGGYNGMRSQVLANITASQEARLGSGFAQASRKWTATDFYQGTGWTSGRIQNHLTGIDFTKPVRVTTLNPGTTYVQHVAGNVGNYFGNIGATATQLGINPAGRSPMLFTPITPTPALESTAARILDTWTVPSQPYQTTGGSTQYFIQNPTSMRPY